MANVVSKIGTNIAYGAGAHRVTLKRGDNEVSDATLEALKGDKHFARHLDAGHLAVAATPTPAPKAPAPDPRARLPKESDKAYNARMKKLDDEAAVAAERAELDRAFLAEYDAMTDEDKTAMYPTLEAREKALVDGPRPE